MRDIQAHGDWLAGSGRLDEATYVGKKHSMMIDQMRDIVSAMCDNISESPDFEATREASERAIEAITAAFTSFCLATKKAMEKVGTNYAGV